MRISGPFVTLCLLLAAADARAEWGLAGGVEHFAWTEHTSPLKVKEAGPLLALRIGLSQPVGRGFLVEYRGRFYLGEVTYDGSRLFEPSVAVTGNAQYWGTTQQGWLRHPVANGFDAAVALDWDFWRRRLGPSQVEDYRIVSIRIGTEHAFSPSSPWHLGAGFKFTLATDENAHFEDLGFDQNPALEPGGGVTPYLDLGYAFAPHWSLGGSFDGFSFSQSNEVVLAQGPTGTVFYQPASDMRVFGLWLAYH